MPSAIDVFMGCISHRGILPDPCLASVGVMCVSIMVRGLTATTAAPRIVFRFKVSPLTLIVMYWIRCWVVLVIAPSVTLRVWQNKTIPSVRKHMAILPFGPLSITVVTWPSPIQIAGMPPHGIVHTCVGYQSAMLLFPYHRQAYQPAYLCSPYTKRIYSRWWFELETSPAMEKAMLDCFQSRGG